MPTNEKYYVLLTVLVLASRVLPRLLKKKTVASDTYYHLFRAEKLRKNRFRLPASDPQLRAFGGIYYPPLYHYILALFPIKARYVVERYLGAICDTILVLLIVWFLNTYLGYALTSHSFFLVAGIIALNPLYTYFGYGPRAYTGTARIIGQLFYTVAFIGLFLFLQNNNPICIIIFGTSSIFVLLSSRFGAQAWLFTLLILAVALGEPIIVLYGALVVIATIILTQGFYLHNLREQLRQLINYTKELKYLELGILKRTDKWAPKTGEEKIKWWLFHNYYVLFASRNIYFLLLLALLAYVWGFGSQAALDLNPYLIGWALSMQATSILTSTKHFLFLGEGERYLEYAACPVIILMISNLYGAMPASGNTILAAVLFGYCIPYYITQMIIYWKWHENYSGGIEYLKLIEKLRSLPKSTLLLIIKDQPWRTAYLTDHSIAFAPRDASLSSGEPGLSSFFSLFPWPHADLQRYARENLVKYVVAEKEVVEKMSHEGVQYDFTGFTKLSEEGSYAIYQFAASPP